MRKFILLFISVLLLAACGTSAPVSTPTENQPTVETGKAELSKFYASLSNENSIVPFYNVNQDTKFVFHFNSNDFEPSQAVTVHTDPACGINSTVYQVNDCYKTGTGYDIVVKPGSPVLNSSDRAEGKLENYNWGNSPIYYLRVNYDLNSETKKELTEPIIIPFTVKREISTPNVEQEINPEGLYTLRWNKVDNAVSYNIYSAFRVRPESKARELTRSEAGYVGDHLTKIASTKETSFNDWNNAYQKAGEFVYEQNGFGLDTYYVTAVDSDGNESSFSLGQTAWKLSNQLPSRNDNMFQIGASSFIESLPSTIFVTMKDGNKKEYPISYTLDEVIENVCATYNYKIEGTMLTGHLQYFNADNDYPETIESDFKLKSGVYIINQVPNIIPENTFAYTMTDNNSNGKIEILKEDNYAETDKLIVDPDSLLTRADEESARIVTDGVYTKETGPTPLVYIDNSKDNNVSENQDATQIPENKDNSSINPSPAQNSELPSSNSESGQNSSTPSNTPLPSQNTESSNTPVQTPQENITETSQNTETSNTPKPEIQESTSAPIIEETPDVQTEEPSSSPDSASVAQEPAEDVSEISTEPTQESTIDPSIETTAEPVAEPSVEPTIEPTIEPTEEPVAEEAPEVINVEETQPNTNFTDFPMFADTEEEAYLAINMINQEDSFSIINYPALTNFATLSDVILKVIAQNPYILDPTYYELSSDGMVRVTYSWDDNVAREKQIKIKEKAEEVVNSIITSGMSDEEKNIAIWDYLENNSSYDRDILEYAQNTGFESSNFAGITDSFNAYGILINKVGVCESYAKVYKLLGTLAGLDVKVLLGDISGLPHAWSLVKIDGQWTWVDATNNVNAIGAPYWIFQTSTDFASSYGNFALNNKWELDNSLYYGTVTDMSKDYYVERGLYAETEDEAASIFEEKFTGNQFFIKYANNLSFESESFGQRIAQLFVNIFSDPREAINHLVMGAGMFGYKG